MSGVSDLAQDVFAGVFRQIQIEQNQVWNGGAGISALPADESKSLSPIQQVDQFEWEVLLLQRPAEEEDIRVVVFNHNDLGGEDNRRMFQTYSRRPVLAGPLHHFTLDDDVACDDTCFAVTIHLFGAGPTK